MSITLILTDEDQTRAFARRLAAGLRPGDVVALWGDLGSGKTALVRAAVRAILGDDEAEVPSPTFTLVQVYDSEGRSLRHFDLYRLDGPDEVTELGWEDELDHAVSFVEWPDRLGPFLPADRLDLRLSIEGGVGDGVRRLIVEGQGRWASRAPSLGDA